MSVPSKPLRISGACPKCDKVFFFSDPNYKSFAQVNCTADCDNCGELLMIQDGVVYPFHEKLNAENPSWPKDGAGTASIGVSDGMPPGPHQGGGRVVDKCAGEK